ncbi:hypothetical protein, partial [Xanthomonas campestris]
SVAWITPQHQAGSVAYLWCVVQRFLRRSTPHMGGGSGVEVKGVCTPASWLPAWIWLATSSKSVKRPWRIWLAKSAGASPIAGSPADRLIG